MAYLVHGKCEHSLGSVAADALEGVDDPLLDLVVEFIEHYVLLVLAGFVLTEDIDLITCQLTGQLDIAASLTDGKGYF